MGNYLQKILKRKALKTATALTLLFSGSVGFAQNNSLDLNGSGHVEISSASSLLSGSNFTMELMLNISSFPSGFAGIVGFQAGTNFTRSPSLWVQHSGGTLNGMHYDSTESGVRYTGSIANVFPSTNTWYHIAWVKEGSIYRFYIDGELVLTRTGAPSGGLTTNSSYNIGKNDNEVNGLIDEFRIWSDVRTQAEIQEFMGEELTGSEDDLQAYYNFNASAGTSLTDNSGNGFGGSLTGGLDATDWTTSGAFTTWDNTGTADWTTASNWSNGVPGTNSDNIGITAGGTQPEISTTVSIKNLSVKTGASLTLKNGGDLTASGGSYIANTASLTLESGSDLTVAAGSDLSIKEGATLTSAGDITVASTGQLILEPNSTMTSSGDLAVTGANAIVIQSTAAGTGNLVYTGSNLTYPSSGSVTVQRYLSVHPTVNTASYHYVSSPVTNQAIFGDESDLYGYKESTTEWITPTDLSDGFTNFDPGAGYAMRFSAEITKEFVGEMNNGNITEPVTHTSNPGDPYEHFNFFGNPYPSSISATSFITANSGTLSNTINFWSGLDFAVYNTSLAAGTAGSEGATPDDNISVGQAFFVESSTAGTATFTNAMRTTDSDNFYRQAAQNIIRLNVKSAADFNQIIIAQHDEATTEIEALDSKKLSGNKALSLYSIANDSKLAIQALPELNATTTVQLGLETNNADWFTFSKDDLTNFDGDVYLWDSYKNHTVDLGKEDYKVFLDEGSYNNRFKMIFALREGLPTNDLEITAYVNGNNIQFDASQEPNVTNLRMYGINGQLVKAWTKQNTYDVSDVQNGAYLLQIETKEGITKRTRIVLAK